MPSDLNYLFELLSNKGLRLDRMRSVIAGWTRDDINRFLDEATTAIAYAKPRGNSSYEFFANSQLSGAPSPCSRLHCRLKHVDRLARFAVLYSDEVFIGDPFARCYEYLSTRTLVEVREEVFVVLYLLYHLRPLFDAGVLSLVRTIPRDEALDRSSLVQTGRLEAIGDALYERFDREVRVLADKRKKKVLLQGSPDVLEHDRIRDMFRGENVTTEGRADRKGFHRVVGRSRDGVLRMLTEDVLKDLIQHSVNGAQLGVNYLTDRPLDFRVLESTNTGDTATLGRAMVEGLTHSVPMLYNAKVEKLIELRKEEEEAFQVYRDAVSKVIKKLGPGDEAHVRQAFSDEILPEVNKIELAVKNARYKLGKSAVSNVIFGAGIITVGIVGGILTPEAGKLLAEFGGTTFALRALNAANAAMSPEPEAIRDNAFYFLWKVENEARIKH